MYCAMDALPRIRVVGVHYTVPERSFSSAVCGLEGRIHHEAHEGHEAELDLPS